MKVFEVINNVEGSGEYILGAKQTGSHACYMIYGVMKPGEKERELKAGKGHEELFFAVKGDFRVTGHYEGQIREGQAIHLKGEEACLIENISDSEAVYIMSGGHSEGGHH
jgi:hypothetical protein